VNVMSVGIPGSKYCDWRHIDSAENLDIYLSVCE